MLQPTEETMSMLDAVLASMVIGLSAGLGVALALLRERKPLSIGTRPKNGLEIPVIWLG